MKIVKCSLLVLFVTLFASCGNKACEQPATSEGFNSVENNLKAKFGKDAYYTDVTITYNKAIGNIVGVTVTDAPETLKMEQWNQTQDTWNQNSDITIEIPEGTKASDFMFQLGDTLSLKKLGELVEQSIQRLKDEKNLKNPMLSIASINFPDNGDVSKAEYMINLTPENGGATFSFYYTLGGELIKMDY